MDSIGPFLAQEHISRNINLPSGYGKDRIVAMVRDPWWIFVYWEITPQREGALRKEMEGKGEFFDRSVLRIYDITEVGTFAGAHAHKFFDITLQNMAKNWYADIGYPGRQWCVEIGLLSTNGNFYALARSNIVTTPRFGMSDILDAAWMISEDEYWQLFGDFDLGKSSLEMKEWFKKRLQEWVSSGGIVSFASHIFPQRR